tara:strand:- start:161 stop:1189 length:1029 start_codon:yes stop_codon:yes gene_type:complete
MMMQASTQNRWDGKDIPLPGMARLATQDINEIHDHMTKMFCPHDLQIEGVNSALDFRHHQASLKSVTFNATDYGNRSGRVSVKIPPMEELYLVQFSLSGSAEITQGNSSFDLCCGEMCVLDPDEPVRQIFCEGYMHFTVKIEKTDIEAVLAQELGFRPGRLHFSPKPVPLHGAAVGFARLVRTICDDMSDGVSAFTHLRAASAVEQTLHRLLLAAVPHNHSDLFNSPVSAAAPYYVRRVEEFIDAHLCDPIALDEMIEVSGVSARSLHAGFRRFRDTTPMNYLKNRRLVLANSQLRNGADAGQTVTQIALECGFTHLSKFARDYHGRFGELPSETLKKMGSN